MVAVEILSSLSRFLSPVVSTAVLASPFEIKRPSTRLSQGVSLRRRPGTSSNI